MRVLVAEDDEVQAELVQVTLEASGYDVTLVHDGIEALQQIQTGQYRLVISDWEMPNMNGLELCRHIRGRRTSDYVYVILLTQKSGSERVVEGMCAGADDFISKPFHPQELCIRLRAAERILTLQSRDLTIFALAKLTESRDQETGAHLERMREYCRVIAQELTTRDDLNEEVDAEFC